MYKQRFCGVEVLIIWVFLNSQLIQMLAAALSPGKKGTLKSVLVPWSYNGCGPN